MLHRCITGGAFGSVCAFLAAAALAAPAPSPTPSPSSSPLPEIGRVTTSDRRSEPIDRTSRPTFVVTRAQFEAEGARTVTDALALIPGIQTFVDYYGFGNIANYGIRGTTSAQTLFLLDGIPLAGSSSDTLDLGTFPLAGVSRIEVVESGGSTLYGTNAVGGVINIITAPVRGVDAAVSDGSYADRDVRVALGDGKIGASFERHVDDNDFAFPAFNYPMMPFPAGVRTDSWADQSAARINLDQSLGSGFVLKADVGSDAIIGGAPGGLSFLTPTASESIARDALNIDLSRATAHSIVSLTASGTREALVFVDPNPSDCGGESDTYDGRSQISLKDVMTSDRSALVAGVDLARESASFALCPAFAPPFGFASAQSQAAAYLQEQWTVISAARLTFGLRGENDAPRGSVLAPEFGGVIDAGQLRIAGNVTESFRVPSLVDLYYPGFSNPNLVPERAQNSDVTLELPHLGGGVSLGWFGRSGSNFIVLDQNFVPQNIDRASVAGLMLTAATPPFGGMVAQASVTDVYRALDLSAGTRLPRNPVMQASFDLARPFGSSNLSYGIRTMVVGGTYAPSDTPFGFPPAYDAYSTVGAYLRVKLAANAILSARAANIGNERYAPVAGYPALGRTFSVELSTR
jgi:vitamin B12 transporter